MGGYHQSLSLMSGTLGRPIRLVTFDLDDTLVDTFATIPERVKYAYDYATKVLGVPVPELGCEELVAVVLNGHPDERPDNLLRGLGLPRDHHLRAPIGKAYGKLTLELLRPTAGAVETFAEIASRYAVAVITNGEDALQREKLRVCGLDKLAPVVLTSGGAGVRKPDPRIFGMACEATGVRAEYALHVGDSPESDVAGAKGAGFAAVRLRSGVPHPEPEGLPAADAVVGELRELLRLL